MGSWILAARITATIKDRKDTHLRAIIPFAARAFSTVFHSFGFAENENTVLKAMAARNRPRQHAEAM